MIDTKRLLPLFYFHKKITEEKKNLTILLIAFYFISKKTVCGLTEDFSADQCFLLLMKE